jgi:hypothetical protein
LISIRGDVLIGEAGRRPMPRILVALFAALIVLSVVVQCRRSGSKKEDKLPLTDKHTSELSYTGFAAHLHVKLTPDRNLIYCGSFQLAWNALSKLVGEPVRVEPDMELVETLNRRGFEREDVDPRAVTVAVEPEASKKRVSIKTTLEKNLRFAQPFTRKDDPLDWISDGTMFRLTAFGLEKNDQAVRERQARQVAVVHYKDAQEYVVSLKTRSPTDLMVLARVQPGATLGETYSKVDALVRKAGAEAPPLEPGDSLAVPFFNFRLGHDYKELVGKQLRNERFAGWFFERAFQRVRLRLDERGALLSSESEISIACSKAAPPSRVFAFNKPFLLYLRQKEREAPYLVMWVGHPRLLVSYYASTST